MLIPSSLLWANPTAPQRLVFDQLRGRKKERKNITVNQSCVEFCQMYNRDQSFILLWFVFKQDQELKVAYRIGSSPGGIKDSMVFVWINDSQRKARRGHPWDIHCLWLMLTSSAEVQFCQTGG